jgi:tetratricopeptide (TPR) repeat protein
MKHTKLMILVAITVVLTACGHWKTEVNLEPERRAEIETQIAGAEAEIKAFTPSFNQKIPDTAIIDLAEGYRHLGQLGKGIRLYKRYVNTGTATYAIKNNLGRMYDIAKEYDKSIEVYEAMLAEYGEPRFKLDIIWAYIRKGDRHAAQKLYNQYQLEHQMADEEIQLELKKLLEAEIEQDQS